VCWWWPARAGVHGGGWRKPEFAGGMMALSGCGATRLIARPCVGLCVVAGGGAQQQIMCRFAGQDVLSGVCVAPGPKKMACCSAAFVARVGRLSPGPCGSLQVMALGSIARNCVALMALMRRRRQPVRVRARRVSPAYMELGVCR